MKKALLLVVVFFFSAAILMCQKIDSSIAKKIASNVFHKRYPGGIESIKNLIPIGNINDTLFYVIPVSDSGFVIVSAEKSAPPVLGICSSGVYDPNKMPPGLLYLFEKYKYSISELRKNKTVPTKKIENQWKDILSPDFNNSKSYTIGTILCNTEWGQSGGYNAYCPPNCPAGCTAVAMAQILRYWACRIDGQLNDYMWINMDNAAPDNDNALLIHDCGIACDTDYDPDGSSSTPDKAHFGFVNYFGISNSADVKARIMHLSQWQDMLEDELDLERPLLYSGAALLGGGHSWVIDGYDYYGNFHCNWGWYGNYNDYYSLGSFDPGGNGPFDQYESAIFNVVPNQPVGVGTPVLQFQSFTYNPNGYPITVPAVFGASSYEWTTNHGTITGNSNSVQLYSDCLSNTIQVRAYNNQCQIYSPYCTSVITLNYGPITGQYLLCNSEYYTVTNVPSNMTITWHPSANISQVSPPNSNPSLFQKISNGNGSIYATVTNSCGSSNTSDIQIHTGPYSSSDYPIAGPSSAPCRQYVYYSIPSLSGVTSINWTWPSGWTYVSGQNTTNLALRTGTTGGMVLAGVNNICGQSGSYANKYTSVYGSCLYSMVVTPNPASNIIDVLISDELSILSDSTSSTNAKINLTNKPTEYKITIMDNMGTIHYSSTMYSKTFTLPVNELRNGNYYITAFDGINLYTTQLIIMH